MPVLGSESHGANGRRNEATIAATRPGRAWMRGNPRIGTNPSSGVAGSDSPNATLRQPTERMLRVAVIGMTALPRHAGTSTVAPRTSALSPVSTIATKNHAGVDVGTPAISTATT